MAGYDGSAPPAAPGTARESLVGRRVRVQGKAATVRWGPGELEAPSSKKPAPTDGQPAEPPPPTTVTVVGIEYDEQCGKHDGTHNGQRLFVCEMGFGSFAKLEKVELGVSVQYAITEKYLESDMLKPLGRAEAIESIEYVDSKGREKEMTVEFVGRHLVEQRYKRLEAFMEISLAETSLESRYPEDVWQGDWSFPNMRSLWLDRTLISQWADVLAICELCPVLEWLSLAKCRLASVPAGGVLSAPRGAPAAAPDARVALEPFKNRVKTLVLNDTFVTWDDILALDAGGHFPYLEHLHLARNRLSEGVPLRLPALPRIQTLVLDGNGVQDWGVLQRAVCTFPSLTTLHLNSNFLGNSLENLDAAAEDNTPRRLTGLFISENKLSSWRAVAALSRYAVLELKAQRNPLTEGEQPLASSQLLRQVFVALMPTLLRLNASEVTVKERTTAERSILALLIADEARRKQPEAADAGSAGGAAVMINGLREACDMEAHLQRLRNIHGEVAGGAWTEQANATRNALVNTLVEVRLRPIAARILEKPVAVKRVPHTMTVAELKRLCATLFKEVPLQRLKLLLCDSGSSMPFSVPFDDESRELGFYGIADGSEIKVDDTADEHGEKVIKRVENAAAKLEEEGV
eukprot:gnl/TRDRNA2_/TRDRNA2_81647_c0_seq1.p1 gnl/TRDRNA2_/TRDRNA2_81647_c0~~gnl/TRDRNA2_/TRDRNA2_81647_c0_seq1.p1  ORF type:complete len:633 (+),score=124.97 gnl/TRDRNA2_/TRDRNA2_81647_c0_seq1:134-2032(+)